MIGKRFGKLLVISEGKTRMFPSGGQMKYWLCRCDCGTEKEIAHTNLLRKSKNGGCGCIKSPNIIGQKINSITVLKLLENRQNGHKRYLCQCCCGKEFVVNSTMLIRKNIKTCQDCSNKPSMLHNYIPEGFFNFVKYQAKKRSIKFEISSQDILDKIIEQQWKCPYTNLLLSFGIDARNSDYSRTASIDRIDSSKGYTKDNIRIIHKAVNMMKYTMEENEFLNIILLIAKNKLGFDISDSQINNNILSRKK